MLPIAQFTIQYKYHGLSLSLSLVKYLAELPESSLPHGSLDLPRPIYTVEEK